MLSDIETSGGAAIAASRLAEALIQLDAQVTRIVSNSDGLEHPWSTKILRAQLWEKVPLKVLGFASKRLAKYTRERLVCQHLHNLLIKLSPDVINVHNLHGACNLRPSSGWSLDLLAICAHHAPTVWTLHDMWSFTGRCVYSYDCYKFLTSCDALCPTPTEYPTLSPNYIAKSWSYRKKLFTKYQDLVAVSPSHWLAREANHGIWKDHRIEVIPHGLPLEVYKPIEKNIARKTLGIETYGPVLIAAGNLNERRKGGRILIKALQKVSSRPLTLITFGQKLLQVKIDDNIRIHQFGYINSERMKVFVYNAGDLFIHPAPVDNLPLVVMEAIACGTPVVGFAVGGVSEMVRPRRTGWLADEVSPEALAEVIDTAIADIHSGVDLQSLCRVVSETEYRSDLQAQRYLDLFKSL